jgi:hypothetical protein
MRPVVVCLLGMVSPVAIAVVSPASAESLKSVVRTLNAIINPEDAWRLEDQARRHDRSNEAHYWHDYGAGLDQHRRERGETVPPHGGWNRYSTPIDPDEAYRLQDQARRDVIQARSTIGVVIGKDWKSTDQNGNRACRRASR